MKSVEKDLLRIEIILMPRSGLMIGICETLRSLVVTGRNERELDRCLPSAIEYLSMDCRVKPGTDDNDQAASAASFLPFSTASSMVPTM